MGAAREERQAAALRLEAGGVGHRGHLDAGLGAVDEAVEHLRVHAGGVGRGGRDPEVLPHRRRGRLVELRQVARALAGADHGEAAGARPVDQLADQRRLIAVGEAVDQARLPRPLGEHRSDQDVRLDVDHHQVTTVVDRGERVARAGARIAGRLDHHVQTRRGDQGAAVVGEMRCARSARPASKSGASICSSGQPASRMKLRARSGCRSATPSTCSPGVGAPGRGTWCRTCPRRSGRPASARRRPRAARADGGDYGLPSTMIFPATLATGAPPASSWR